MSRRIDAVVDTTVILDIYSGTNIFVAAAADDAKDLESRRLRTRDALLLAWHFHSYKWVTLSVRNEATEKVRDPNSPDDDHAQMSLRFLKDLMLSGWSDESQDEGETTGSASDIQLVELAMTNRVPLFSSEGLRADGTINEKKGLRKKARARGVEVTAPSKFLETTNIAANTRAFLSRFDEVAPAFVASQNDSEATRNALLYRRAFLEFVLRGDLTLSRNLPDRPRWMLASST